MPNSGQELGQSALDKVHILSFGGRSNLGKWRVLLRVFGD